ncbi:MAG: hypothetical protein PHF57_09610 [Methanoregula sp.]|nr:hypothetical protein [Methanoregula sp.]
MLNEGLFVMSYSDAPVTAGLPGVHVRWVLPGVLSVLCCVPHVGSAEVSI